MALRIDKKSDSRVIKCILHRIADVPGGVTVSVADLGGSAVLEGTPLGYSSSDAMYHVAKTALIVSDAANNATTYDVAKGHHFKVGDRFAVVGANGQLITAIDKTTNATKDVVTLGTTLGVALTAANKPVAFQSAGADQVAKYPPIAVAGNNEDVVTAENMFQPAWVIAVLRTGVAPVVNSVLTASLKGITYIV